jgi:hypothetical protein
MTTSNLKIVVSFDKETRAYKPAAHNLSPEQALEQVNNLQNDGVQAAILDQEGRHRSQSFHNCKFCLNAAKQFTERQEAQPGDGEQSGDAASAAEQTEAD